VLTIAGEMGAYLFRSSKNRNLKFLTNYTATKLKLRGVIIVLLAYMGHRASKTLVEI
jgi:hypothetical protein